MDEEAKSLLKKNLEYARENNRLLRKMRRSAIIGTILRMIWWAILIGLPIALYYYFLQPFIGESLAVYQNIEQTVEDVQGVGTQFTESPFIAFIRRLINF